MNTKNYEVDRLLEIEHEARELQLKLFEPYKQSYKRGSVDLVEVFDPGIALHLLSYDVVTVADLGRQKINGVWSEIAGTIDISKKRVEIAQRLQASTVRFTTAHELAHAVLHPDAVVMHRDFPLEKTGVVRDWREIEANRYASAFLMARLLMEDEFGARFGTLKFKLTDATANALCGTKSSALNRVFNSPRQLSQYLAGATKFNGYPIVSMSERFKVSPLAMAIRLEELGIVEKNEGCNEQYAS